MAELRVQLCASLVAGQVQAWAFSLPAGSCVADALRAAGLDAEQTTLCGIWGRVAPVGQLLRDGDRVEVYRALTVDPKVARRERFARQGARATGLFVRQRPGGKAGY